MQDGTVLVQVPLRGAWGQSVGAGVALTALIIDFMVPFVMHNIQLIRLYNFLYNCVFCDSFGHAQSLSFLKGCSSPGKVKIT